MLIERSPADVVRVVVAAAALLVLLLIEWLFGDTLVAFATQLLRGLDALPQWIVDVVVIGTRVLGAVILGGGLLWIVLRHRWAVFARVVAAGVIAALLVTVLDHVVDSDHGVAPIDVNIDVPVVNDQGFPSAIGIGMVAAALTAAAPWLSRNWRRAGWALLVGLIVTRFVATPLSFDSFEAAIIGWLSGAGVLVIMGAPSRRPTIASVIAGLADVGLAVQQLDRAGVDARGPRPTSASRSAGRSFS